MFILYYIKNCFKLFFNFLSFHVQTLVYKIDLIKKPEDIKQFKNASKLHFLFPAALTLFIALYGTFGLHYRATGEWPPTFESLSTSPYTFIHQAVPNSMWQQFDFILGFCDTIATVAFFLVLAFTDEIKKQFCYILKNNLYTSNLKLIINCHVLSNEETETILRLRAFVRMTVGCLALCFTPSLAGFFYFNLVKNNVYERSAWSLFQWAVLMPLYMLYYLYCK